MRKQRFWMAGIVAMSLLVSLCAMWVSAESLTMGDLDRNGVADSRDARVMLRQITGTHPLDATGVKQADLNGNGRVDTSDVRILLQWTVDGTAVTAPTITVTTTTVTTPTTTTTRPSLDDEGYYDNVVKP